MVKALLWVKTFRSLTDAVTFRAIPGASRDPFETGSAAYVCATGSPDASGLLPSEPLADIQAGIALAGAEGFARVRICAGTYLLGAPLVPTSGISLYGGYDGSFSSRDVSSAGREDPTYRTLLTRPASDGARGISFPEATTDVRLSGLVIQAGGTTERDSFAVYVGSNCSVTVDHCTLHGGSGGWNSSRGIYSRLSTVNVLVALGAHLGGSDDMHLLPTAPVEVRAGGLALSNLGIIEDGDGLGRTTTYATGDGDPSNVGAAGWSMGAFEQDD